MKQASADKAFEKFLAKNADKPLTEKMANKIASYMGLNLNAASMQSAVASELVGMKNAVQVNEGFIKNALRDQVDDAVIAAVSSNPLFAQVKKPKQNYLRNY